MYKIKYLLVGLILFSTLNLLGQKKLHLVNERSEKSFIVNDLEFSFELINTTGLGEFFFVEIDKEFCSKINQKIRKDDNKYLDSLTLYLEREGVEYLVSNDIQKEAALKVSNENKARFGLIVKLGTSVPVGSKYCIKVNLLNELGEVLDSENLVVHKGDASLR